MNLIKQPGSMMLSCRDANTGALLDLACMTAEQIGLVHGARNRATAGIDTVCKGCHHPVSLVRHGGTGLRFWRHYAGRPSDCCQVEFNNSESPEHLHGKQLIARALNRLPGWEVESERHASADGVDVFVDVYAKRTVPGRHALQVDTGFEVQLSHQATGVFSSRGENIQRITGARSVWATPDRQALDSNCGLIIDGSAAMVVDRFYTHVDQTTALDPTPLDQVVTGIWGNRRKYEFAQSGDILTADPLARPPWIVWTRGQGKPRTTPIRRVEALEQFDRDCDRVPAQVEQISDAALKPEALDPDPADDTTAGRDRRRPLYAHAWMPEQWEGRARMAAARVYARVPLDGVDREALRRNPDHRPTETTQGPRLTW